MGACTLHPSRCRTSSAIRDSVQPWSSSQPNAAGPPPTGTAAIKNHLLAYRVCSHTVYDGILTGTHAPLNTERWLAITEGGR